jgi:hypothetical protein
MCGGGAWRRGDEEAEVGGGSGGGGGGGLSKACAAPQCIYISTPKPTPQMSDPFNKQFGLVMNDPSFNLLAISTLCAPTVHPATRLAKLKEWHNRQIKWIEEEYTKAR